MYRIRFKLSCTILFLLGVFSIPRVNARSGILVISPMQEVTETVELKVSKSMQVDVRGNISVINGFVDFYVISPSGNTMLRYNEVSFCWFNFSAIENGTYTMHLMNIKSEDDIVVTLIYGLNFKVSVQEALKWHTVTTWQITATTSSYFNILRTIWEILKIIFYALIPTLVEQLPKFFRWLQWIKKYRKSKTPVVLKPINRISH